jgi:hypothetical protein
MALPWVRLDTGIKIVHLMLDPSPKRYQTAASYMFSLAWSGVTRRRARHAIGGAA